MFSNRPYQTQLIENEIQKKVIVDNEPKEKTSFQTVKERARKYLVMFLETSSIHGLNHLVITDRHPCEV